MFGKNSLLGIIFGIFLTSLLFSCSGQDIKNSENPEIIYTEASKLIEDERFLEATELLNEIRLRFPQSRFFALADLKTGDLYFKQESFTEAAAAYSTFVELYPNHQKADYALAQKAKSFFRDTPEIPARDQGPASDAIKTCDQFLKKYPSSPLTKEVQEIRVQALVKLAEKEAYIARFYEIRSKNEASLKRWRNIVENFKEVKNEPLMKSLYLEAERKLETLSKNPEKGV
jgi:outer membrane protein assembly factor BamD